MDRKTTRLTVALLTLAGVPVAASAQAPLRQSQTPPPNAPASAQPKGQTSGGAEGGLPARATHRIVLNGRSVDGDVAPVFLGKTVMVPVRFVSEYLGGKADWNPQKRLVTLTNRDNEVVRMTIGSNSADYQGESRVLSQAPVLKEGRTLIPLREVARLFTARVDFNENARTVFINTPGGSLEPPRRRMTSVPVDTRTAPSRASRTANVPNNSAGSTGSTGSTGSGERKP